jgi:hypothetical protein
MTDSQLNKREEDIQKLIAGGVRNFILTNLVPFGRKKLHQTND